MTLVKQNRSYRPQTSMKLCTRCGPAQALKAATQNHIFEALDKEGKEAGEVARELKLDVRGTQLLLDAMVALGFLAKTGEPVYKYSIASTEISEQARTYLNAKSPLFMGPWFHQR